VTVLTQTSAGGRYWVVHVDSADNVIWDFGMRTWHEIELIKRTRLPGGHRIEVRA